MKRPATIHEITSCECAVEINDTTASSFSALTKLKHQHQHHIPPRKLYEWTKTKTTEKNRETNKTDEINIFYLHLTMPYLVESRAAAVAVCFLVSHCVCVWVNVVLVSHNNFLDVQHNIRFIHKKCCHSKLCPIYSALVSSYKHRNRAREREREMQRPTTKNKE